MDGPPHWVMDYETLANCFVAVFKHYKTDEQRVFVVHDLQDDFNSFIEFLRTHKSEDSRHISYNGLGFDAQITHRLLEKADQMSNLSGCNKAKAIYKYAQSVINRSNAREWLDYYEYSMSIKQIDVFKLNHWDNVAKKSALKWIQYMMDWKNLQDMPIHHTTCINSQEEITEIVKYCINDVDSTKHILYLSKKQIALRQTLTKKYNINLYNASEPKISKELFSLFLCEKTGISKYDLKNSRTQRDKILVKDIILPYIRFQDPDLIDIHNRFKASVIQANNTKGSLRLSVNYKGVRTDFGLGGLHGANVSGIYEAVEGMTIMTSDVKSYYPNLAIQNGWAPAHLPREEFCELYKWFYDERVKIPKKDPRNYVYKIILNSTYGLSNDRHCFLYDPQFTMQITINGQLSLMMLYERIMTEIPGAIAIMQNTDGLETMIPTEYVDRYMEICKDWEQTTKLVLEHDEYQRLILADVNNYIAINKFREVSKEYYEELNKEKPHELFKKENGKFYYAATKCKGRFEWDVFDTYEISSLHKNKSNLVTAKALYNFFVKDISPESYIQTNRNIFDYCIGKKAKSNWTFKKRSIESREFTEEELQPTIRYYISKKGAKVFKCNNTDGREIQVESGKWLLTIFNNYENKPWDKYDIDEQYYIQAIYREIANIAGPRQNQLSIF